MDIDKQWRGLIGLQGRWNVENRVPVGANTERVRARFKRRSVFTRTGTQPKGIVCLRSADATTEAKPGDSAENRSPRDKEFVSFEFVHEALTLAAGNCPKASWICLF